MYMKAFQIIAKSIPNNTRNHIPMNVCMLYICQSSKYISNFDLNHLQIERSVKITHEKCKSGETRTEYNFNMHINLFNFFLLQFNKRGYIFIRIKLK